MSALIAEPVTSSVSGRSPNQTHERYPYGWREVLCHHPEGIPFYKRIPLTLADVLHPQEDDVFMPSDEHTRLCIYLFTVLSWLLEDQPDALVLSEVNIDWGVQEMAPHRPDLAVIFGIQQRKEWSTFYVAEEGTRPTVIIEITSPKTRTLDLDDKVDEYEQMGVPFYVIVDKQVRKRRTHRQLIGWQMTPDGYAPMPLDEGNRLWLEPLKVWLSLEEGRLICYDQEGQKLFGYSEVAAARKQAELRAAQEAVRAARADARAAQEAARAAHESARATEEAKRAKQAEARAEAEAEARALLESRIRLLEEELARQQGERKEG
jgi:Uma2 family endonuclease